MRRPSACAGFTLLEISVAIAVGLILVYTVYAGFRVATQTVTVCNRLSTENRLLSAGLARAVDEADFWNAFDRPGWQPCRTVPSKPITGNGGYDGNGNDSQRLPQPFTRFADAWKEPLNGVPTTDNAFAPDWLPHDPRAWYRGDGALNLDRVSTKADLSLFGNYALFSGTHATVVHGAGGPVLTVGAFAADQPPQTYTWYADQHKGLKYALGFYGWWDYLPANALIDWYDRDNGSQRAIRPFELSERYGGNGRDDVSDIGKFARGARRIWQTGTERPVTRSSYLYEQVLGICAPRPGPDGTAAGGDDLNRALRLNRWMGGMKGFGFEFISPMNRLSEEISRPVGIVANRPDDWPRVDVDVRRYRIYARSVNECFVRLFDPASGRTVELNFRTIGTSLRGARLQRALDG